MEITRDKAKGLHPLCSEMLFYDGKTGKPQSLKNSRDNLKFTGWHSTQP